MSNLIIKKHVMQLRQKKKYLLSQIEKYNVPGINNNELDTWNENKLKK